ncbi:MAG: ankyrin repeat domain-containing protein [Pleurocapsa sp. MO_226.B13]|nr:ankyrin repeat domain-containing protein [Pleurocapsa sp. MO_226.B13]
MMQDYVREGHLNNELWDAIEEENIEKISELIESGCDLNGNNGASFEEGMTFLIVAAAGNLEIVKLLVESGADVNAMSTYGDSALFNAVLNGHQKIADYLEPLTNTEIRATVNRYVKTGKCYPTKSK